MQKEQDYFWGGDIKTQDSILLFRAKIAHSTAFLHFISLHTEYVGLLMKQNIISETSSVNLTISAPSIINTESCLNVSVYSEEQNAMRVE